MSSQSNLEKTLKEAMKTLLVDPVNEILDGVQLEEEPRGRDVTDEVVLDSFDKLKTIINSLDISTGFLESSEGKISSKQDIRKEDQGKKDVVKSKQNVFCPFSDCNFTTSKKNLKEQKNRAANHLKERHNVTSEMIMKAPEDYKWKRSKVQK